MLHLIPLLLISTIFDIISNEQKVDLINDKKAFYIFNLFNNKLKSFFEWIELNKHLKFVYLFYFIFIN